MELQTLIVMLVVLGAALYMGRRLVRTLRGTRAGAGEAGCASGCGCGAPAHEKTDADRAVVGRR